MTPQELKNSILQLAIQGKLVEQRAEEGTAEELFARIQQEKQRLIAEKKIKKEKPLPEITEDEKSFEIPESWKWVRLGDIFQHNTGKALNSTNRIGVSLKYITTSNLYWNRFELENLKEMFFTDAEVEKCTVKKGDLLVCEGGDFGRAAIWKSDDSIRIQNHIHRLRAYKAICTEFFYYLFYLYKHAGWIGGKISCADNQQSKLLKSVAQQFFSQFGSKTFPPAFFGKEITNHPCFVHLHAAQRISVHPCSSNHPMSGTVADSPHRRTFAVLFQRVFTLLKIFTHRKACRKHNLSLAAQCMEVIQIFHAKRTQFHPAGQKCFQLLFFFCHSSYSFLLIE